MERRRLTGLRLGLAVISALTDAPEGIAFNQLATILDDVPAPTLSRTLKTLQDGGWVAKGDRNYRIGPEFLTHARRICGIISVADVLKPIVDDLAQVTDESAAFAEFFGPHFKFTTTCDMADSFHYMACGLPNPKITFNPFSITILAHLPSSTVNHSITIAPPPMGESFLREHLSDIRINSFYFTDLSYNNRFVAPVFQGNDGIIIGAIGITRTESRGSSEEIQTFRQAVADAAQTATHELGKHYTP